MANHEGVAFRFAGEEAHLKGLPVQALDTYYRVYRKAHKDCTVHFETTAIQLIKIK